MRGSNWKALNGNVLMVWIGGRLWEVVANGGLTVLKNTTVDEVCNLCS